MSTTLANELLTALVVELAAFTVTSLVFTVAFTVASLADVAAVTVAFVADDAAFTVASLAAVAAVTVAFVAVLAAFTVASLAAVAAVTVALVAVLAAFTVAFLVAEAAFATDDVVLVQMPAVELASFCHRLFGALSSSSALLSPSADAAALLPLLPMLVIDSVLVLAFCFGASFMVAFTGSSAGAASTSSSLMGRFSGFLGDAFGAFFFDEDADVTVSALFSILGLGGTGGAGTESVLLGGGGLGGGATSFSLILPSPSPSDETGIEFTEVVDDELEDML